ncbi:hypothetical protein KKI24_23980 [bacterium]|nr:hypothetical protein [bacterium]
MDRKIQTHSLTHGNCLKYSQRFSEIRQYSFFRGKHFKKHSLSISAVILMDETDNDRILFGMLIHIGITMHICFMLVQYTIH